MPSEIAAKRVKPGATGRRVNMTTGLGQWIDHQGMSLHDFGALTGVSYRTVSQYLEGSRTPPPARVAKIIEVTGLTIEQILGDEGYTAPRPRLLPLDRCVELYDAYITHLKETA